jgi:hypothetical protein
MAEELLVKEALSNEMIAAGRELVAELDQKGWLVKSAFWIFESEQNRWKLILSSPNVETRGPRDGYEIASTLLSDKFGSTLSLSDISIVPPRNELVKLFSSVIGAGGAISDVRFSRNTINGRYIPDAYIYRS